LNSELNVIEQRYGKSIDKENCNGAQKWVDINTLIVLQIVLIIEKIKAYQIIATPMMMIV
jgi:tRNA (guanosine-2'-O-)-methyltransferase